MKPDGQLHRSVSTVDIATVDIGAELGGPHPAPAPSLGKEARMTTEVPMTPAVYQILLSLADGDRHGYGIMQEVEERTDGEMRLGPGTLYRSIKRLRKACLIEGLEASELIGEDDDRRRFYRITASGRKMLEDEARRLARLVAQAETKRVIDATS